MNDTNEYQKNINDLNEKLNNHKKLLKILLLNQYKILLNLQSNPSKENDNIKNEYEKDIYDIENGFLEIFLEDKRLHSDIDINLFSEVGKILDMYDQIINYFKNNPNPELINQNEFKFYGFDGNNESVELACARYWIDRKKVFSAVKAVAPRDLNSHYQMMDKYRKCLAKYNDFNHFLQLKEEDRKSFLHELFSK